MIVPFSDIPSAFLTPLNVDTEARYTLDMKKFPGLSGDGPKEPALLLAQKKVTTNTTDHDRESCSSQLCLSLRSKTQTPMTSFNSCLHIPQQQPVSLFEAQRELYQLLDSYQVDCPKGSSIVSNPAVTDRRTIPGKGDYMESFPRSVNQNREMCVPSLRKMLSASSNIESSRLNLCHRSDKFASCVRLKQSQVSSSNTSAEACVYQNGSAPDKLYRPVTGHSCLAPYENDSSSCGGRQGLAFTQPLFGPVLSSCSLADFPTPDYITKTISPFATHDHFVKTTCSYRNRVMPYTYRQNDHFKRKSGIDYRGQPNSAQYLSQLMNESVMNFNFWQLQSGYENNSQCLRV